LKGPTNLRNYLVGVCFAIPYLLKRGIAMKMSFVLAFLLIFVLSACNSNVPAFTAVPALAETKAPKITQEPTVEIAQPKVPNGLRPENAATQVVENGTWVVKNSAGTVTAIWNSKTEAWTYITKAINVQRAVIGFEGQDINLLAPFFQPLPPDNPENHFIDPATGDPVPFGFVRDTFCRILDFTSNKVFDLPVAVYAVRDLGIVQVDSDYYAYGFELPFSIDMSVVFVNSGNTKDGLTVNPVYPDQFPRVASMLDLHSDFYSVEKRNGFIQDYRGGQVLIEVYHDVPDELIISNNGWEKINDQGNLLLGYLNNQTGNLPAVDFWRGNTISFFRPHIAVPVSTIQASSHFQ
jgi:hypothetical protein